MWRFPSMAFLIYWFQSIFNYSFANSIFIGLFFIQFLLQQLIRLGEFWALLFLSDDADSESLILFRLFPHLDWKLITYLSRYSFQDLSCLLYLAYLERKISDHQKLIVLFQDEINTFIMGNEKGLGGLKELEKAEKRRKRIRVTSWL